MLDSARKLPGNRRTTLFTDSDRKRKRTARILRHLYGQRHVGHPVLLKLGRPASALRRADHYPGGAGRLSAERPDGE